PRSASASTPRPSGRRRSSFPPAAEPFEEPVDRRGRSTGLPGRGYTFRRDPLRGRLTVGRLTLDQEVGVRIPAPQPQKSPAPAGFSVARRDAGSSLWTPFVPIRVTMAAVGRTPLPCRA